MKLFVHKALMFFWVIMGIVLVNCPAYATDVSGVIDTDTTWYLAESPYRITNDIQIANGVTLTIDPGVVIDGQNNYLKIFGILQAVGNSTLQIYFSNLHIETAGSQPSLMNIEYSTLYQCSIWDNSGEGIFILKDSRIEDNTRYWYIHYPPNDCYIERNSFINSYGIIVCTSGSVQVYIKNNLFFNQYSSAIVNDANYDDSNTIVEYNSFLSTDKIAMALDGGSALMTGINNYWNTSDTNIIDEMIYDKNDDLTCDGYIEYIPFLTVPHPDTPILDLNQTPTANAGSDQVVFDTVTLDGSLSSDPDGEIVSYGWELLHKVNSNYNQFASGVNPTITDLYSGFYDVTLTVTDDEGGTNTDSLVVAASGPCVCTASTMYIVSIIAGTIRGSKGQSFGEVTVTVSDDYGKPVAGATVYGTFYSPFDETSSGVTDGNGVAVIRTIEQLKKPLYDFCVDDVVKDSLTYDYVETCANN